MRNGARIMGAVKEASRIASEEQRQEINTIYAPYTNLEAEKEAIKAQIEEARRYKAEQQAKRAAESEAIVEEVKKQQARLDRNPGDWQARNALQSLAKQQVAYSASASPSADKAQARLSKRLELLQSGMTSEELVRRGQELVSSPGYSSPERAVGYNPVTGQVEVGRGDDRGVVVSVSKTEDKKQAAQAAKAAGYTASATIDPRSQFFKPTEGANIFTGKVYIPPEPTRPQTARKQIQTGQPDSIYANPSFVQPEPDKMTELQRTLTGFAPSATPPRSQYRYDVGLSEGLQLGSGTAPTTQDARVWLAQRSAEGYKFVDIQVGGTVKRVRITEAFAQLSTLPGEATLSISYNDPKAIKERAAGIQARRDVFGWIQEAKTAGVSLISIRTETGDITVPIDQAAGKILGTTGIIGIGAVPNVPAGYTVTSGGNISRATLVPETAPKPIERKPVPGDILGETLYNLEKLKSKNPVVGSGKVVFLNLGVGGAGILNLGREYIVKPIMEGLTGKPLLEASTKSYIPEKATSTLTLEEGLVKASQESIEKKNWKYFPGGAARAYEEFINATQSQGPIVTAADIATQTVMTIGPGGIAKIAPLRKIAIAVPVTKKVPTIIGAPATIVEDTILATGIKLGYSKTVSPLMVGAIQGGDYFVGVPKPSRIPALQRFEAPIVRGEPVRGGYPITEELSGYMKRPETLDYLVKIGKLKPEAADILKASERYAKMTSSYPDEVIRTTLPDQPVRSIEKGPETSESFRLLSEEQRKRVSSLGPHYGSYTEQFYMLPDYLEQSRDLDFHLVGKKAGSEAERIAAKWGAKIQSVARPERQFFVKTKYDDVYDLATGKKTGEKEIDKVILSVTTDSGKKPDILTKIKPDFDETHWIGKEKPEEDIIVYRSEPDKLPAKLPSKFKFKLGSEGLSLKQFQDYKMWNKTNPGEPLVFFFGHTIPRLFASPGKSEAWAWGLRLSYFSGQGKKNIMAIKIKKGAIIEKDVNIRGITKDIDPRKPIVNPSEVDILTPNKSEWIILKKEAIEEIRPDWVKPKKSKTFERTLQKDEEKRAAILTKIKPDFDETHWIGKENVDDIILYHGTPIQNARNIIRHGFSFSKAITSPIEKGTVFLAKKPAKAIAFAAYGNIQMNKKDVNAVLKVVGQKSGIVHIKKLESEAGKTLSSEQAIIQAKKKGYTAIDLGREGEIQGLSSKFFKSVEIVGRDDPIWNQIAKINRRGGNIVAGTKKDIRQYKTPDTGRKIILGEEGKQKVSELIVKPADAPKKLGDKYTSMFNVLGQKVPTKTKKVKNVKIGDVIIPEQEITVFRRNELRRVSAAFEYQKGGRLVADPGREKEYTKLYGIAKTREAQALKMGRTKEAAEIAEYAEKVKAYAILEGVWTKGLNVAAKDEGGIIVKPPLKERAVESLLSGTEKSTTPARASITSAIPASTRESDITGKIQSAPPSLTPREETLDIQESRLVNKDISKTSSRITSSRISSRSAVSSISRGSAISKIQGSRSSLSGRSRVSQSKGMSRLPSRISDYGTPSISKATQPSVSPSRLAGYSPGSGIGSPASAIPGSGVSTAPTGRTIPTKTITPIMPKSLSFESVPKQITTIPLLTTKHEKRIKEIEGERANFLGNTYVEQITGLTKRADITYGLKRTAKLERQDIAFTRRGKKPFVSNRKSPLLSLNRPGVLRPNKGKTIRI